MAMRTKVGARYMAKRNDAAKMAGFKGLAGLTGVGVGLAAGSTGNLAMAAAGLISGFQLLRSSRAHAHHADRLAIKARAMDTIITGQTRIGAMYGRTRAGRAFLNAGAEKRGEAARPAGGALKRAVGGGWAAGRGFANSKVQAAAQAARRRSGK